MSTKRHQGLTTRLLHADRLQPIEHGAVHKPLHLAAAYSYPSSRDLAAVFQGDKPGYVYARQGNPTGAALEQKVTLLEEARATAVFSTGMAAIGAIAAALLKAGDHVVTSQFLFGNTNSLMQTLQGLGIEVSFVDATDVAKVEAALRPTTRIVFTETIANPRTQVADLAGIGELCAARGLLYVVDSTLTTPVLFKPKDVQAGFVVHSLTKAIGGHGDAMGGAVVDTGLFDWARYPNILPPYRKGDAAGWGMLQLRKKGLRDFGATLRPEDAHRIAAGAETLALRMARVCDNALQLARWLDGQPQIDRVHYPGLSSHAEHERAAALFKGGFGGLLSFELKAGLDCFDFLDALQLVIVSSHLADNRTLAIPVAHTIFYEMGAERRAAMGIADGLVRLSVGIEDADDLKADFEQALARVS
ncbi:cystathionine gamma-synthase family protein [Aquabacterium sp. J223]|uniref:cystathionine gamma-synthase family protein n=1 Tax=Aquabacterium sp. J223 TaxID=2898431 RepID=UPI0021AE1F91|nr:cystathionine gamma-synthase family protein [Aquabacterium sp. J223]UUX97179.1 cystathionine gamma-synthase family protein [Aquabacterium sp. J223]